MGTSAQDHTAPRKPGACALPDDDLSGILKPVSADDYARRLRCTPIDQWVIWTGGCNAAIGGSRVAVCLRLFERPWTPISLRQIVQRAASFASGRGLAPEAVRNALRQHQKARPAVLLLARRAPGGAFLAVYDIPSAGAVVGKISAGGELAFPRGPFCRDAQDRSAGLHVARRAETSASVL